MAITMPTLLTVTFVLVMFLEFNEGQESRLTSWFFRSFNYLTYIDWANMKTYRVTYTTYEKGSCMVVSEGTMDINTSTAYQAEQAVKAIFAGLDVIIRYTN